MWLAGLSTELAIFTLRRYYVKGYITDEAYKATLKLLKDARVRIRNAQESFDSRDNTSE